MNKRPRSKTSAPLFDTFVKGEVQFGGWGAVGSLIGLGNMYVLVTFLSVFHYGVYVLILAFFAFVSDLFLGMMQTVVLSDVTRFVGERDNARAKRLFFENTVFQLSMAVIASLGIFFGAELVAAWYDDDIASLIRIASPLPLISALYTTMRMFLRVHLRFDIIAFRSIVQNGLRLALLLSFVLFASLNVKYALIAHVGASFVAMLVFVPPFLRAYAPWKEVVPAREWILWNITKTYGKWALFGSSIKDSVLDIRPWLIKLFVNTEAVALYAVAESMYSALKKFHPINTLRTLISRIAHDRERSVDIVLRSIKYLFLFNMILFVFGLAAVPLVVLLLFPHYSASIPLFLVLLLTLPFLAFRSPTRAFLTALRRQRFLFLFRVFTIVSALVLPLFLLPLFGVMGMALERVLSMVAIIGVTFWYITRRDIPLSSWRRLFQFDKEDKRFFLRTVDLLKNWAREKAARPFLS